jgi:thiol-disulfide isomerase/thioredoxin
VIRTVLGAAGALAVAVAVAGCGAAAAAQPAPRLYTPPLDAPALAGSLLGGGSWSLRAEAGHVVVVNFWQSDCAPCAAEAAVLDTAARADAPAVRVLGVDVTDTVAAGLAYQRIYHQPYPSLQDPDAVLLTRFGRYLNGGGGTPDTLVFTAAGRLAGALVGQLNASGLATLIRHAERVTQ